MPIMVDFQIHDERVCLFSFQDMGPRHLMSINHAIDEPTFYQQSRFCRKHTLIVNSQLMLLWLWLKSIYF